VLDRLHREVDVGLRPVEVIRLGERNVDEPANRSLAEPGELGEGEERLPAVDG
jgi:hypothetical protein